MNEVIKIGGNIRAARIEKGMTQRELAHAAELSTTQLSEYENDKKNPGLPTLAKISRAVDKSIDELYFGDTTISFANSAPDKGTLVVNCFIKLWEQNILDVTDSKKDGKAGNSCIALSHHVGAIKRLMDDLYEFDIRKDTYDDPDAYLGHVTASIAKEINNNEMQRYPVIRTGGRPVGLPD